MTDQKDTEIPTTRLSFSEKEGEPRKINEKEDEAVLPPSVSPPSTPEPLEPEEPSEPPVAPHPRAHFPAWKWRGTMVLVYLCCVLIGYDISNVANIQPRLYEAFGHIELVPWIGLSYSLANFSVVTLARKLSIAFNMRWIFLANQIVFIIGSAIAGSAQSMHAVIVGRIIMGIGGSIVQQGCYSYFAVLATPAEMTALYGMVGGVWALGLVTGGPIGSGFAENETTTWRWAFYINLPFLGVAFILAIFCLPDHKLQVGGTVLERIRKFDPIGIILHMATGTLFAIALTFSGSIWDWGSGPDIAVWVVFAVSFVSWILQQYFCILTTREDRSFPAHMLNRFDLMPLWIASACAAASYGITLYYTPLFFAFARGYDAMGQTVRMLPYILLFIIFISLTGRVLPKIGRYFIIYIVGGSMILAASAAMANILDPEVSQSKILGLLALLGMGAGMTFQHGIAISNVINKDHRDRVDSLTICNMAQMGGVSLILAAGGSIFQNVGHTLLVKALGDDASKYSDHDIREALAGVSSIVWESESPTVLRTGIDAVAKTIAREFYIVVAFGALCIICAFFMKWEKLDFGNDKKKEDSAV